MAKKIPQIILASTSPRRKQVLSLTGLKFKIVSPDYEEDMTLKLAPRKLAAHLSMGKAESVATKNKNAIIIAADTFLVYGKKVLGKPKDKKDAVAMLRMLSGKKHSILTGIALLWPVKRKRYSAVVETKVLFKRLTPKTIHGYLSTAHWQDKAGSYAVQELGGIFISKIEGEFSNVVGLPLGALIAGLKNFGIDIFNKR